MGRNTEKDAAMMAKTRERILETAFQLFADRSIEKVKMSEVAEASGIGIATLYRYYNTKPELVIAVGTRSWKKYIEEYVSSFEKSDTTRKTVSEIFERLLDSFTDLYQNHKDILRFNQFFNIYMMNEKIDQDLQAGYIGEIKALEDRFASDIAAGMTDGTLSTETKVREAFSVSVHLMLAAATRYAVGLVYLNESEPERELQILKKMLIREFTGSQQ